MYTIKEAATRAGLGVPLVRAWERRYGIVQPERTASGYRLYDDTAIETLREMQRLVDDGWPPSEAARALLAGTAPARSSAPGPAGARGGRAAPIVDAFVAAAAALDSRNVEAILDEMLARGSFEAIIDDLLLPATAAVGDAWAAGRLDVAAEHAASAAVLRRLAGAFQAAARPPGRPVLVGLPPGSRHELGALAFAIALRRRGIDALYLGADVPEASWVEAVATSDATMAVLAVVTRDDREPAAAVARALRAARPGLPVALGGAAADGVAGRQAGVVELPPRVVAAADAVADLLADGAATIPFQRP
jgi:MerR family transcriptional regulator, light-induced transcriptional regulator